MIRLIILLLALSQSLTAQDYFYKDYGPFESTISSPEEFLGYAIGDHHTRHDLMVAYLAELARQSDRATLIEYGKTFGNRKLVMLQISAPDHLADLENIRIEHLNLINPESSKKVSGSLPIFINLGYNVHGNEPSGGEAALLTAYTMVASNHPDIINYRENSVIFLDPVINPDGRDRHTHWANMHKGSPRVSDPIDIEHHEGWPRGRTNHYWFDLNRDWLLGINPESRGKLAWYHDWYPNVVTDFHEMGTGSTFFFEPMKPNGSMDPIMPKKNYVDLNEKFAKYFSESLDDIGSLYFTKEVFDGTYPGYGSSYPDLQGGLGLLFEQASSRGHVQDRDRGKLTFAFTIRNQFVSSLATIKASVENKTYLHNYQREFFDSAITRARSSKVKAYVFGDAYDKNRNAAFLDKLLLHHVSVFKLQKDIRVNARNYSADHAYYVPTDQAQFRMVQTMFETYDEFQDSVFYDASAWSLANFYNMPYAELTSPVALGEKVTGDDLAVTSRTFSESQYAYLVPWEDYNSPALLYDLLDHDVKVNVSRKPFSLNIEDENVSMSYGSLVIPVASQDIASAELFKILTRASQQHRVDVYSTNTGYASSGIDLGSGSIRPVQKPKAIMLVHGNISGYEAGEVWHLLDQRVHMPITKVQVDRFNRINLSDYNTMVLVSGSYNELDSSDISVLKDWISKGNTLITSRTASAWAIRKKLVNESLIEKENDDEEEKQAKEVILRKPYVNAREDLGQDRVGGIILEVDLDITHPLAYGYRESKIPIYRNSTVWLKPSKNPYANVGLYTADPHIDGFITKKNMDEFLKKSASIIVSPVGNGRVVLFADNPNFRGSWYGTNKLFLNAVFFGNMIQVPD